MTELQQRLRGVLAFPVTPFRADFSLDLAGLEKNVAETATHPFCALVAAGGAGEIYSLTVDEAVDVVRRTVQVVAGRMPVFGGVGFNTPMAVEMAQKMEKAGADALLVLPPYYVDPPLQGFLQYYQAIGSACGLPLCLYSRGWAAFSPEMVARLADCVPTLQVWKDGQGDMRKYQRIMTAVGNRLAWLGGIGDDSVPGYFAIGVQGFTSGFSNIAPKICLALAEAGLARDFERLDSLLRKYVLPFFAIRERSRGYEVAAMKKAMEVLGKPAGPVRPPLTDVSADDADDIRRLMDVFRDMI